MDKEHFTRIRITIRYKTSEISGLVNEFAPTGNLKAPFANLMNSSKASSESSNFFKLLLPSLYGTEGSLMHFNGNK